jgi:hypothetical protein
MKKQVNAGILLVFLFFFTFFSFGQVSINEDGAPLQGNSIQDICSEYKSVIFPRIEPSGILTKVAIAESVVGLMPFSAPASGIVTLEEEDKLDLRLNLQIILRT